MTNQDFSSANNFHLYTGGVRLESLPGNDYLTEVYCSFSQILQEDAWRILKIGHAYMPTTFIFPQPLQKRILHRTWSSVSSFNLQYPVFFLGSFSNFLRLLPHLPVIYILPSIFPLIMCLRRQFLRKM